MQIDELLDRVARSPLHAHAEWFSRWHRPAIQITTTDIVGTSRFGGAPELAIGTSWPCHEKGPYRFLGQIDLADLAPISAAFASPWKDALPRDGLMSLFVADDPTGEIDPKCEIFWGDPRYGRAILSERGLPRAALMVPRLVDFGAPVGITFQATIDVPQDPAQVPEWPFTDWAWGSESYEAYGALRSLLHGDRYLFGYPSHCSLGYDPTPTGQLPLLTLDSDEARDWQWHDGDNLMLFVDPAAVRVGAFSLGVDAG